MTPNLFHILFAEDDDGQATLVQRYLKRAGIANPIVHVKDGQEALDYLRGEGQFAGKLSHELILMLDINMPRVDGIEVLRQVKADKRTASIPVFMLTSTDDPREIERCYALGCSAYLTKPVLHEEFVEAIKRLGLFLQIVKIPHRKD